MPQIVRVGDVKIGTRVLFKGREVFVGSTYVPMRCRDARVELTRIDGSHIGNLRPDVAVVTE